MEPKDTLTLQEVRDLIERISKSDFTHFEIKMGEVKLKLERQTQAQAVHVMAAPAPAPMAAAVAAAAPAASAPAAAPAAPPAPAVEAGLHEITSPIVGTFYRSPNPEADVFIETGARIKRGQVLCIVEAMKLMNEIESDVDGEVVDILVTNGQPVEYGEVLFRVRLSAA